MRGWGLITPSYSLDQDFNKAYKAVRNFFSSTNIDLPLNCIIRMINPHHQAATAINQSQHIPMGIDQIEVGRKLAKTEKRGITSEVIEKLRLVVKGRNNRVASLEKKLAEFDAHRQSGTIPKVIFGGRKLWERICKGPFPLRRWWKRCAEGLSRKRRKSFSNW
ncbi:MULTISPECIES: hypothetical protein [unclassified Carboxydocella]|uniref:hypothetical protein n=1 Tax=unclassified Carboxydocella TaxID=2685367 RepID=UPI0009AEE530|nr:MULTISPECIES: hypothetical protein [unclassified Carboxydocella]